MVLEPLEKSPMLKRWEWFRELCNKRYLAWQLNPYNFQYIKVILADLDQPENQLCLPEGAFRSGGNGVQFEYDVS